MKKHYLESKDTVITKCGIQRKDIVASSTTRFINVTCTNCRPELKRRKVSPADTI